MARTWTLHATLSIISGGSLPPNARALVNGAGNTVYFPIVGSPQKVYAWDGSTITDIAGSTFPITGDAEIIQDICVFDGSLFCSYGPTPVIGAGCQIYRYNSGQSWSNEYSLRDESDTLDCWTAEGYSIGGAEADSWVHPMDCDENYMAIVGTIGPSHQAQSNNRLWTRDVGGNYQINEIQTSDYEMPGYHLVGRSKGSDYSGLVGYDRLSSSDFRPMLVGGPDPWAYLTGSGIGRKIPIGYGDGKSFFSHNTTGTTWELKYSTDWGSSVHVAGGLTRDGGQKADWQFKNLGGGIIMLGVDSAQAYTWDSGAGGFVADGTTGSQKIYDFFILNDQLFALTDSSTANSVEIWTAGGTGCQASFYYGIEVPTFASNLPFCVNPGGLAISSTNIIAVLGTVGGAAQSVVFQYPAYNNAEWNDISGIVPTGTAVTSIKFV